MIRRNGSFIAPKEFVERFRAQVKNEQAGTHKRQILELPLEYLQEILEFEDEDVRMYALWKIGRRKQSELAQLFSKTQSAISHGISRAKVRVANDKDFKSRVEYIEEASSYFKN